MTAAAPVRPPVAGRLAIAAAFLLGFLWQVLGAVSNLLAWTGFAAVLHRDLSAFAWGILVVGLLIPPVAFAAALVSTRRRSAGVLALVLAAALCASQAVSLSQLAVFEAAIGAL